MVTVAGETEIVTESETEEGIKNDPRRDSLVSQTVTMRETGKGRGGEVGIISSFGLFPSFHGYSLIVLVEGEVSLP